MRRETRPRQRRAPCAQSCERHGRWSPRRGGVPCRARCLIPPSPCGGVGGSEGGRMLRNKATAGTGLARDAGTDGSRGAVHWCLVGVGVVGLLHAYRHCVTWNHRP
eukprot:6420532-Prymnesium_polylepis.1